MELLVSMAVTDISIGSQSIYQLHIKEMVEWPFAFRLKIEIQIVPVIEIHLMFVLVVLNTRTRAHRNHIYVSKLIAEQLVYRLKSDKKVEQNFRNYVLSYY